MPKYELVTLDVFYYMPDYHSIIQEFIIQFDDVVPEFPRISKFLNYWKTDIKVPISRIFLLNSSGAKLRTIDSDFKVC